MSGSISKIPRGVRYFIGREVAHRRQIETAVLSVFHGWSYDEIDLPVYDYHDLFAMGMGREEAKRSHRFVDHEGELLALRPDLTSLVARTVATRFNAVERPIRLCYSGEVFRLQPAQKRPHDVHQLGLEHIGNDRPEADLEVIIIAIEALIALGVTDFKITISHVDFFNGIADNLRLDPEQKRVFLKLLDSRNVDAIDRFLEPCTDAEERKSFCSLIRLGGRREVMDAADDLITNPRSREALTELFGLLGVLEVLELDRFIEFDFGDVVGLDYYTGMTFKIYTSRLPFALGSGGRYDRLLKAFGSDEPAVGFQLSLDHLAALLPFADKPTESVRLNAARDLSELFSEARDYRSRGVRIEIRAHLGD